MAKEVAVQTEKSTPAPPPLTPAEREQLLAELAELQGKLHALQGEAPLILPSVDQQAVASVVSDWTGIPVGKMVSDEVQTEMFKSFARFGSLPGPAE